MDIDSTDEEIFRSLQNILCAGSSFPDNFITDLDPYKCIPSHLPGWMWFLTHSHENKGTEFGFWEAKTVSSRVFPNSTIIGWKTTLIFYEGQPPYACKTDWMMHEYKVIKEGNGNNGIAKEELALCRVFTASQHSLSPRILQNEKTVFPNGENLCDQGSSSFQDNQAEIEHQWDDYIELLDLDLPLSPSETSLNSSCPILLTDECFDPFGFLDVLNADIPQDNFKQDEIVVSRNIDTAFPNFGDGVTLGSNNIVADDPTVPLSSEWGSAASSKDVSYSDNVETLSTSKPHDP